MKVLFLLQSETLPSSRIRFIDLVPFLKLNGIEPSVEFISSSFWTRRKLFKSASQFDAVVLQKKLLSFLDFRNLRRRAKKLAFDFDDAIYCRDASPSQDLTDYESRRRKTRFGWTVTGCDLVIAANQVLARKALEAAPAASIEIIPSSVPLRQITPKTNYYLHNPPVLGWVGTRGTLRFLKYFGSALRSLRLKRDFVLRIIADGPFEEPGIKTECVPWTLEAQNAGLNEMDIGLMPLSSDPYTQGKSAYKLLQYLAAGLPAVCSAVGMNCEIAGDDKNCLAASTEAQFEAQILRLLDDLELRKQLGEKGRKLAAEKYDNRVVAAKLAAALRRLVSKVAP